MNSLEKQIEIWNKLGIRGRGSKFLRKESSVLMLSGGIDSVSVLKRILLETDESLYVHHIHLKNNEGVEYERYKKESEAVRKIVPYMKKIFRNFNYTESTIDIRQIRQLLPDVWEEEDYHIIDITFTPDQIYYYCIAGVLSKITFSDKVYIGTCVEDYQDNPIKPRPPWRAALVPEEAKTRQTISEALSEIKPTSSIEGDSKYELKTRQLFMTKILEGSSYPYEVTTKRPHDFLTKRESIKYLGEELMNMVWYCREPTEKNGEFVVCHECRSCLHVDDALSEKE